MIDLNPKFWAYCK